MGSHITGEIGWIIVSLWRNMVGSHVAVQKYGG